MEGYSSMRPLLIAAVVLVCMAMPGCTKTVEEDERILRHAPYSLETTTVVECGQSSTFENIYRFHIVHDTRPPEMLKPLLKGARAEEGDWVDASGPPWVPNKCRLPPTLSWSHIQNGRVTIGIARSASGGSTVFFREKCEL